jgi:hypothetical protein
LLIFYWKFLQFIKKLSQRCFSHYSSFISIIFDDKLNQLAINPFLIVQIFNRLNFDNLFKTFLLVFLIVHPLFLLLFMEKLDWLVMNVFLNIQTFNQLIFFNLLKRFLNVTFIIAHPLFSLFWMEKLDHFEINAFRDVQTFNQLIFFNPFKTFLLPVFLITTPLFPLFFMEKLDQLKINPFQDIRRFEIFQFQILIWSITRKMCYQRNFSNKSIFAFSLSYFEFDILSLSEWKIAK